MHMWTNHKFDIDTPTSLCSWRKTQDHTWCSSRFFRLLARDVGFHVLNERTHVLPMSPIWSSQRWMVIVLITNDTHILANIIIVDMICACFVNYLFFENDYDDCNSSKKLCHITIDTPWRWFHPSSNKDVWKFTPISEQLPSLMCQHGMVNERH
jgi:hypothetical protein